MRATYETARRTPLRSLLVGSARERYVWTLQPPAEHVSYLTARGSREWARIGRDVGGEEAVEVGPTEHA